MRHAGGATQEVLLPACFILGLELFLFCTNAAVFSVVVHVRQG